MSTTGTMSASDTVSPVDTGLSGLVESVRGTVRTAASATATADAVAEDLARYLAECHPLPRRYRRCARDHYTQHVIHTEPDGSFSVVALVWLPGQRTPVHDHVAWCVSGVYEGEEHEERFELRGSGDASRLVPIGESVQPRGAVSALAPPGDIHRVSNSSDSLTVSLHVYGADVAARGSSVRRTYSRPVAPARPGS
ncbi:cysteine dioxygenase family protein [Streptantibioticus parmotrematis]|uniref:cysteine dioxygenase family protein n=1 Tax=Streptantibioticus parmotrematis TaxID=2873249 RepID=UPI0033C878C6